MNLERTELAQQEFDRVTSPARHIDVITELIDTTLAEEEIRLEQLKNALAELEERDVVFGWARHLE